MNIQIHVKDDMVVGMLAAYPTRLLESIKQAMDVYTIRLQARVKAKLTDNVLHVRTGTLRRSINRQVQAISSTKVQGIVGTNVPYAGVHEYGYHGTVFVPEHTRRITTAAKTGLTYAKAKIGPIGSKRTRYIQGMATVKGHSMKMNIPERPFLRPSLEETIEEARELLRIALLEAAK